MPTPDLFKFRQFPADFILWAVRWYLRYTLTYRDLEEMMAERGTAVDHSTIYRWVQRYGPEFDERSRRHLRPSNDSWRLDETFIKVKGQNRYLWRAVDSAGNTLDFLLTAKRDAKAAKRFFRKVLQQEHARTPRSINTDKYAAYPKAIEELQESEELPKTTKHRQVKYLNNILEQDHRFVKRRPEDEDDVPGLLECPANDSRVRVDEPNSHRLKVSQKVMSWDSSLSSTKSLVWQRKSASMVRVQRALLNLCNTTLFIGFVSMELSRSST